MCKCWTTVFSCYCPGGTKEETIKVVEKSGYPPNQTWKQAVPGEGNGILCSRSWTEQEWLPLSGPLRSWQWRGSQPAWGQPSSTFLHLLISCKGLYLRFMEVSIPDRGQGREKWTVDLGRQDACKWKFPSVEIHVSQTLICIWVAWWSCKNADEVLGGLRWGLRFWLAARLLSEADAAGSWSLFAVARLQLPPLS